MPNGDKDYSKYSWAEWKGAIGSQVEALAKQQNETFLQLGRLRESVAFLQGKAATYGAAGGTIAGVLVALVKHFSQAPPG